MVVQMNDYHEDVAALLEEAAALIEQGWTQYRSHGVVFGRHVYCAIGAIEQASYTCNVNSQHHPGILRGLANDALTRVIGSDIPGWNDYPCRTKQEVLDAFHKAVKAVRGVDEDAYTHHAAE